MTPTLLMLTALTAAPLVTAVAPAGADPENPQALSAAPPEEGPPPEGFPPAEDAPPPEGFWALPVADAPPPDAALFPDAALPPEPAPPADEAPQPDVFPFAEAGPPPEDAPPPEAQPEPFWAAWFRPPVDNLDADVVSEQGMQVKTILVARNITAAFPEITSMAGVHPDARPWHPNGLAVDVMIPNPGSAEGIALGDRIVDYVRRNADEFSLQDVIWRGTYYTPGGPAGGGNGHYDHVHITTFGGGRPTGGEQYVRINP